jgi:hypothetical protein
MPSAQKTTRFPRPSPPLAVLLLGPVSPGGARNVQCALHIIHAQIPDRLPKDLVAKAVVRDSPGSRQTRRAGRGQIDVGRGPGVFGATLHDADRVPLQLSPGAQSLIGTAAVDGYRESISLGKLIKLLPVSMVSDLANNPVRYPGGDTKSRHEEADGLIKLYDVGQCGGGHSRGARYANQHCREYAEAVDPVGLLRRATVFTRDRKPQQLRRTVGGDRESFPMCADVPLKCLYAYTMTIAPASIPGGIGPPQDQSAARRHRTRPRTVSARPSE